MQWAMPKPCGDPAVPVQHWNRHPVVQWWCWRHCADPAVHGQYPNQPSAAQWPTLADVELVWRLDGTCVVLRSAFGNAMVVREALCRPGGACALLRPTLGSAMLGHESLWAAMWPLLCCRGRAIGGTNSAPMWRHCGTTAPRMTVSPKYKERIPI